MQVCDLADAGPEWKVGEVRAADLQCGVVVGERALKVARVSAGRAAKGQRERVCVAGQLGCGFARADDYGGAVSGGGCVQCARLSDELSVGMHGADHVVLPAHSDGVAAAVAGGHPR